MDFYFDCAIETVEKTEKVKVYSDDTTFEGTKCIISAGRSGSKWMQKVCKDLDIHTNSNRVDLGPAELPAEIFSDLTDELYESKIVYRTEKIRGLRAHLLYESWRSCGK